MVIKQSEKSCICGQTLEFPEAQIKHRCTCGAVWELSIDGLWIMDIRSIKAKWLFRETYDKLIDSVIVWLRPVISVGMLHILPVTLYEFLMDALRKNVAPVWLRIYKRGKKRLRKKYEMEVKYQLLAYLLIEIERRRRGLNAKTTQILA